MDPMLPNYCLTEIFSIGWYIFNIVSHDISEKLQGIENIVHLSLICRFVKKMDNFQYNIDQSHKSNNAPYYIPQCMHIPQCTIQNRNVHISILNGALWDMGQVHSGICEKGL